MQDDAIAAVAVAEDRRADVVRRIYGGDVALSAVLAEAPEPEAEQLRAARRRLLHTIRAVQEEMRAAAATVQAARTVTARTLQTVMSRQVGYGPRIAPAPALRPAQKGA
jgi:hypothetical protein